MIDKICFKCRVEKPLTEFYRHSQMGDGRLNKCKDCTKEDVAKRRAEKIDEIREYDRKRGDLPHRVAARKEYASTERGKEALLRGVLAWQSRNPEKKAAAVAVGNAVRDGRLTRLPCEVCGDDEVQGHHDDYSKPLEVRWLCVYHHNEYHKAERAKARTA